MRRARSWWPLVADLGVYALVTARRNRDRFQNKIVLITGGSRGLGLCLAREWARQGAVLVLVARDHEELNRAAAGLRKMGASVRTIAADVKNETTAKEVIAETIGTFGRLDVLVNNAGIISVAPLANVSEADFHEAMETHFWAPLRFMNAALPFLKSSRGRIVNISSIGGLVAVPHLAAYSASKFALAGLSDAFRAELASEGIKVTSVFPGLLRTGSHVQARFKGDQQSEFGWFALSSATPLTSMNADRAARQIVEACRQGKSRVILSFQAKLLYLGSALLPNILAWMMATACRFLPRAQKGLSSVKGCEVHDEFPFTWLIALVDRASRKNNELKPASTGGKMPP